MNNQKRLEDRVRENRSVRRNQKTEARAAPPQEGLDKSPHWEAEMAAIKGMKFDSLDDAVYEIAERICRRLGIGYDIETRDVVVASIASDPDLCALVAQVITIERGAR